MSSKLLSFPASQVILSEVLRTRLLHLVVVCMVHLDDAVEVGKVSIVKISLDSSYKTTCI